MNPKRDAREKVVILLAPTELREQLHSALREAGYDVSIFDTGQEAVSAIRQSDADLFILDSGVASPTAPAILAELQGAAATKGVRVILIVGAGAEERAAGIAMGAHDAVSNPWNLNEMLARVRAQLRERGAIKDLQEKAQIAEEGQQIAHTAFEALAVTEKMASDASSLDKRLKIGVTAVLAAAAVMAGIYFLFARSAQKQTQRANAILARLEGGLINRQDLMAQARKLREEQGTGSAGALGKNELQKQAADLRAKMVTADSAEVANLQKELAATNARLNRVEREGDAAESLISADVRSVCLLHVSVAFSDQQSGQRLRYAGLNSKGEPLQDSDGNPILTTTGRGPEVKLDVFGTGFLAGPQGRLITNRHVAEPWWKNEELNALTSQGFQAEISSIHAYFPGDPRAFDAEIQQISQEADLAAMRVDMQDLKRPLLSLDPGKPSAVAGEPIVVMGYATGLAAILARTDEDTARQILQRSGGDVSEVLAELAKRDLIRPLITQGHIGDILPDKLVFDAQTTSGGSGGPVFDHDGKVIGVTFAILKGFEGSNFGIPIRFSEPLLQK